MNQSLIPAVGCLVIVQFVVIVAVLVYAAPLTTEQQVERCNAMTDQTRHQIKSCTKVIDHYLRSKE